jgi:hypothetical protein
MMVDVYASYDPQGVGGFVCSKRRYGVENWMNGWRDRKSTILPELVLQPSDEECIKMLGEFVKGNNDGSYGVTSCDYELWTHIQCHNTQTFLTPASVQKYPFAGEYFLSILGGGEDAEEPK